MIELCSLNEVKDHLRITSDRQDGDIQLKIIQASAIILNYLKVNVDVSPLSVPWGSVDIPFDVHAAAMLVVGDLFLHREGSQPSSFREFDPISKAVESLLRRWRDPAMA